MNRSSRKGSVSAERNDGRHRRDATALRIIGSFLVLLAVLVLLGGLWAEEMSFPAVVNLACGALLLSIGVAMVATARRLERLGVASPEEESR